MDVVTGLPPAGPENYNSVNVVVDRYSKKAKFIPCHKEIDARAVADMWWKHLFTEAGLPFIIISDRDPKFTSEFWKSLMKIMGRDLKLSTAHNPQTDGLAERMIQTLEDMIRRYCAFGLQFTDYEGFTHDWVSLLPGLEFAYNSAEHSTTGKIPYILERGYVPNTPRNLLNKTLAKLDIHPGSSDLYKMQTLARNYEVDCIKEAF